MYGKLLKVEDFVFVNDTYAQKNQESGNAVETKEKNGSTENLFSKYSKILSDLNKATIVDYKSVTKEAAKTKESAESKNESSSSKKATTSTKKTASSSSNIKTPTNTNTNKISINNLNKKYKA